MTHITEAPTPVALAREWLADYHRELAFGPERAEAVLQAVRDLAENARPGSDCHDAYGLLLELLRLEDEDLEDSEFDTEPYANV